MGVQPVQVPVVEGQRLKNRTMKNFLLHIVFFLTLQTSFGQEERYVRELQNLYSFTVPLMKVPQLSFELSRDTTIILLDARELKEYQVSHIKNARHVGYEKFDISKVKNIAKDARIVVYCSVGYRSEKVGEKLLKAGYTNIYNLYGGIFEWKNQSFPVVDLSNKETESVHVYSRKWGRWLMKGDKVYE
jgi:rhodanese-related sulfurtransferase